jgi:hypothetical protein
MTVEEIAARHDVSVAAVEASIEYVQEWKLSHSNDLVDTAINQVFLDVVNDTRGVFKRGMQAKRRDAKGRLVHDSATQLKTVDTLRNFVEAARPKVPVVQNNMQFNNGAGGSAPGPSSAGSFEAWLRNKRAEQGLDNGEDYIDAEGAANEEQSAEDELADIGIDISEEEEESPESTA